MLGQQQREAHPICARTACRGVVLTNWVDVIKVRQQLAGPEGRNLLATGWRVVRSEGVSALGKGVTPAVARGVLYGGA